MTLRPRKNHFTLTGSEPQRLKIKVLLHRQRKDRDHLKDSLCLREKKDADKLSLEIACHRSRNKAANFLIVLSLDTCCFYSFWWSLCV
ncbi:hypothetical protein JTE90_019297 [Oedothorax gibbosus]|uniref:Uncharacterized protein n=1 Tax=Oedothorax gibbosus TaxID=931172 RepID=A0AAV6UY18_9ARAC|nr:hypothetical protein JTE90_019297 [Oedothorax gibbosus]